MTGDRFAHDAAAYALDALAADDRAAFEEHLPGCDDCRQLLAEFARLPALLRAAPQSAFEEDPVPAEILPRLLDGVRRTRRRRSLLTAAAGAASAALVFLAVAAVVTREPTGHPVAMTAVSGAPLTATADVRGQGSGTRIDLVCRYQPGYYGSTNAYRLVVVADTGAEQELGSWKVSGGDRVTYTAGTALAPDQIGSIEIRTLDGATVLRLAT